MKKIIFVRPPRYMWPVINESDNFLLPLSYPCLASVLRKNIKDLDVKIIDCLPLKIGWKSLTKILYDEKPDFVGVGEEALYHHESVKVLKIAKEINPATVTITGGHFFSNMIEYSLNKYPIDYIVKYEGEYTLLELIQVLVNGGDVSGIKGIAFKRNGGILQTPERALIENLDELPIAAYDLMPMGKYSPFGYLWPQSATIEHSRGCIDKCKFCSLWTLWGERNDSNNPMDVKPRYRTKSVERSIEEVEILYKKYNRRYLLWADPTWNVDPRWNDKFCDELIKRNFKDLYWWAFLRADYIVRDEKLGILEKMVRTGLIHPLVGIERVEEKDLKWVGKTGYSRDLTKEAYEIFRKRYPKVFRQGTILTCIRTETKESMHNLLKYAIELKVDYPAFHPVAPVPGTLLYEEAKTKNWLEISDFKNYDWYTPIMSSETITREEMARLNIELNKKFILFRPHWAVKGLLSPSKHRRGLYWWFFRVTLKMLLLDIRDFILGKRNFEGITGFMRLRRPKWYDT